MRLHDPWLLVLLALLPLLGLIGHGRLLAALSYPMVAPLSELNRGRRVHFLWLPPLLRLIALGLLLLALTRPQLAKAPTAIFTEGIDIMLAVDISGSMLAEDFSVDGKRASRLAAVKRAVGNFLEKRAGDRVGLVLFAGRPYTQCPLTLDHGWLLRNLERAEVGLIEDGTAIGSALAIAVARLEASTADSKIIVLLTDGQNNAGNISPPTAAQAAKTLGYRVYTIAAGTRGLAPFPSRDFFGNRVYRPMQVDVDEETLRRIARTTGGAFYRATDTSSLENIYAEIDRLEKTEHEDVEYFDYYEAYPWLALPALLLLFVEVVLRQTSLRVLP